MLTELFRVVEEESSPVSDPAPRYPDAVTSSPRPAARAGHRAGAAVLLLGALASMPPADAAAATGSSDIAAKTTCRVRVVGVDSGAHVVSRVVVNGAVSTLKSSPDALPVDLDALGFYSLHRGGGATALRYVAVAADGVPRLVTVTDTAGSSDLGVSTTSLDQTGFSPRLFADASDYRAYTVSARGVLAQWYLTLRRDGTTRFAHRTRLGGGYGDLASLQYGFRLAATGKARDVLYATTTSGALRQIAVPIASPRQEKAVTLKSTGYRGDTELSVGVCDKDVGHPVIVSVDPTQDVATWTEVRNAGRGAGARAVKRGTVRGPAGGAADWVLHAVV